MGLFAGQYMCPFFNRTCRDDCALLLPGGCAIRLIAQSLAQAAQKKTSP